MTKSPCKNFHWIGETLMAEEFGEVAELCNVDWSGLDEFEAEHKRLIAAAPELLGALEAARDELQVVTQELYGEDYNSPQINAAIAKARGQS